MYREAMVRMQCARCGGEQPVAAMKPARFRGSRGVLCGPCAGALREQARRRIANIAIAILIVSLSLMTVAAIIIVSTVGRLADWHC